MDVTGRGVMMFNFAAIRHATVSLCYYQKASMTVMVGSLVLRCLYGLMDADLLSNAGIFRVGHKCVEYGVNIVACFFFATDADKLAHCFLRAPKITRMYQMYAYRPKGVISSLNTVEKKL